MFERNVERRVRFKAPKVKNQPAHLIEAPIKVEREIKNTSGIPESRFVIGTLLMLAVTDGISTCPWRIATP